jgi:hypothetical protein
MDAVVQVHQSAFWFYPAKESGQLFGGELAVPEDLVYEAGPDDLARVGRAQPCSGIRVA